MDLRDAAKEIAAIVLTKDTITILKVCILTILARYNWNKFYSLICWMKLEQCFMEEVDGI